MAGVENTSIPCESTNSATVAAATSASNSTSGTETINPIASTADGATLELTPPLPQPKYVCAILHREADDCLLLESRGSDAVNAANKLTCFGGKIEPSEAPLEAILRECHEELGWAPVSSALTRCVDLYVDDELIAYFYFAQAPSAEIQLKFEEVCWMHVTGLPVWMFCTHS